MLDEQGSMAFGLQFVHRACMEINEFKHARGCVEFRRCVPSKKYICLSLFIKGSLAEKLPIYERHPSKVKSIRVESS